MTRYYTVEEANEALGVLRFLVTQLVATHNQVIELRPEIEGVIEKSDLNSGSPAASRVALTFVRFEQLLDRINEMGVEVKDPSTGLCDFRSLHEGREIYLCWQLGEERVEWWHELHTGFAGRRHVNELAR